MNSRAQRLRNLIAAGVIAAVWILIYTAPKTLDIMIAPSSNLVVAVIIGATLGLVVVGDWFEKVRYVAGTPIVPVLVVGVAFSSGVEPEGMAFTWLYAVIPVLPYFIGAGGIILLQHFFRRKDGATGNGAR